METKWRDLLVDQILDRAMEMYDSSDIRNMLKQGNQGYNNFETYELELFYVNHFGVEKFVQTKKLFRKLQVGSNK